MAFSQESFLKLRPFLYHTTSGNNLDGIRRERRLRSACSLLDDAGDNASRQERRREARCLKLLEGPVWLQSQHPLHRGNIVFDDNCTFGSLLELLNSKVFFWPGRNEHGPIHHGVRHIQGNSWPCQPTMLRVHTAALISPQTPGLAQFCPYNSGSPRCSGGNKSPRGLRTFLPAQKFERNPGDVVEVVFDHAVDLPDSTAFWDEAHSTWVPLFA